MNVKSFYIVFVVLIILIAISEFGGVVKTQLETLNNSCLEINKNIQELNDRLEVLSEMDDKNIILRRERHRIVLTVEDKEQQDETKPKQPQESQNQ